MQEPRTPGIFQGCESASGSISPFQAEYLESSSAEIRLKDQAVVTGAQNDPVVGCGWMVHAVYGRMCGLLSDARLSFAKQVPSREGKRALALRGGYDYHCEPRHPASFSSLTNPPLHPSSGGEFRLSPFEKRPSMNSPPGREAPRFNRDAPNVRQLVKPPAPRAARTGDRSTRTSAFQRQSFGADGHEDGRNRRSQEVGPD